MGYKLGYFKSSMKDPRKIIFLFNIFLVLDCAGIKMTGK